MSADRWPDEIMPYEDERHEWLKVHGIGHPLWDIVTSFPHHLPKRPMSDLAALEAAVIQAADAWRDRLVTNGTVWPKMDALDSAVDALRAAKTPPPPPPPPRTEWRVITEHRHPAYGEWFACAARPDGQRNIGRCFEQSGYNGIFAADVIVSWLPLDGSTE